MAARGQNQPPDPPEGLQEAEIDAQEAEIDPQDLCKALEKAKTVSRTLCKALEKAKTVPSPLLGSRGSQNSVSDPQNSSSSRERGLHRLYLDHEQPMFFHCQDKNNQCARPQTCPFSANKLDVIRLWSACTPRVFGLLKVEMWSYIAKTQPGNVVIGSYRIGNCS